jgi:hypothetical protein
MEKCRTSPDLLQNTTLDNISYMGEKYASDELVPTWMHTEIDIYETFVMTDRGKVWPQ